MPTFSFDIVSEVDMQEIDNAMNQTKKELSNRFDFKTIKWEIDFNRNEKKITLLSDSDFKLRAIKDVIATKLVNRGISPKALVYNKAQDAFGGNMRQIVDIIVGIDKDRSKDLVKIIKNTKLKVQVKIEGEKLRVSGSKKDDLQAVMKHLKSINYPLPLNFVNYR